jgi:hypothetical protein
MNVLNKEILETISNDVYELCRLLFRNDEGKPLELYNYQIEIVETIMKKTHKKTLCWATTRAGKSLAVALGAILSAVFNKGEIIPIVAPTGDHAKIIMSYVIQHVLDTETVMNTLAIDIKGKTAERLRAELSKKRITFKNNSEIRIISADITREGRALIGWGGNTIIVDETESIPDEIIRTKMIRMLGDSEDSIIFLISNPIKKGFMYDARTNTDWHQIKIGWEQCVNEGRLSKEFIDEQRNSLSQIEFTIWYEADYPEDTADTLIKWKWIEEAIEKKIEGDGNIIYGADIAELGTDKSVLTKISRIGNSIRTDEISSWEKKDTMQTVGIIVNKIMKESAINVDSTGVGKGVYDRLIEMGYNAIEIKGGRMPESKKGKDRFEHLKDEIYWNLRELFEQKIISIPKNKILISELNKLTYEITSAGKIKVIKPEDKSPDFSDSLALACINTGEVMYYPVS